MREDIKERIDLIKKGKVPEGYKKTKLGIIPEDWNIVQIKDILEKVEKPVQVDKEMEYIQIGIRSHGKGIFYKEPITGKELGNKRVFWVEPDCLIVNIVFAWEQAVSQTSVKELGYIASHRFPMYRSIDGEVTIDYLVQYFLSQRGKEIMEAASPGGAGRNRTLGQERFMKSRIICPMLNEQYKIAQILKCKNQSILLIENEIKEKSNIKKYLTQNLLTGKKRIAEFSKPWNKVKLDSVFIEIDDRTKKNNEFEILSVTKKGICLQSTQFNKQIASENNIGYKILRKGNLVFSTMNLWMGSLDVLEKYDIGIVSPAYKVFKILEEKMIPEFGKYFMKSSYMIWLYNINSEQGASVVRKNLDLKSLLKTTVKIPDIKEQIAISKIMKTAEREIELLENKLELIKQEKKAMMQLLLTGIARVND